MTKKMLRIGVIHSGRLIDEFTIKDNKSVTLGNHVKNNILVKKSTTPKNYKLFTIKKDKVTLHILNSMELDLIDGVNKNNYQNKSISISLSEKDKGKIKINKDVKVLFQFITPYEECTTPQKIPPQFRNKIANYFDLRFFIPLLVSIVLHMAWIITLQTMEYDPAILTVDQIPDRFKSVIIQNEVIKKEPIKVIVKNTNNDKNGKNVKSNKIAKKVVKVNENKKLTREEVKSKAKKSAHKKSKVLRALNQLKSNPNSIGGIEDNSNNSGNEVISLSEIYNNNKPSGTNELSYGSDTNSRGRMLGASNKTGISRKNAKVNGGLVSLNTDIGKNRKELKIKKIKKVAIKTKTNLNIKLPNDGNLNQRNATRAIDKTKRQVNRCYQSQTKKNNSFAGRVTIVITIGADGKALNIGVMNIRMNDNELSNFLSKCIKRKLKRITFPIPQKAPINIKFTAAFSASE